MDRENNTIDIKELFSHLWLKKRTIFLLIFLSGIFSIGYSLTLTNEYTAVIHLTEVKTDKETSLSSISNETTFGITIPGVLGGGNGLTPEMNKAITMMKTWDFVDEFIRINNLEIPLLAGIGWDESSRKLIINNEKYDESSNKWVNENFDINHPSVRWELYKKFLDEMRITGDKNTGIHLLSVTSYSPDLALEWANEFYKLVNKKMRAKQLALIDNNIANLQEQITKNSNALLREKLYDIQSRQINTKIIIEASPEYVLEPIGNALTPYERSFPRRTLLVLALTFVGALISIIIVIGQKFLGRHS